jgi:hypothetical protein
MIAVRYAVCSERQGKPVTRCVVGSRAEAEQALEQVRRADLANLEASYWIAELGPESDAWRTLAPEVEAEP